MHHNFFFNNKFKKNKEGVNILNYDDDYTINFGKQWKKYLNVQIDSLNKFNLSKNFLENLLFDDLNILSNKNVLEIGSGAGRFTEYIAKYSKRCVSVDLSSSIYYNVAKNRNNVTLIKANYYHLTPKNKFDIVICRGVLQHTPQPTQYLLKLYEFVNNNGFVYFDFYPMPKTGLLHPKYLIWRPLLQKFVQYEKFEYFLNKNITFLLYLKRKIKKIFLNSRFISDLIIPVWDYKGILNLTEEQLEKWSILDTLDGIYAKYDKPYKYSKIVKILNINNIIINKDNKKNNYYKTSIS